MAFGRHYYDLINYGRATGDWKPAKGVTAPSCEPCQDIWAKNPRRMDNELSIRHTSKPYVARFDESQRVVVFGVSSDSRIDDPARRPRDALADGLVLEFDQGRRVVDIDINNLSRRK